MDTRGVRTLADETYGGLVEELDRDADGGRHLADGSRRYLVVLVTVQSVVVSAS